MLATLLIPAFSLAVLIEESPTAISPSRFVAQDWPLLLIPVLVVAFTGPFTEVKSAPLPTGLTAVAQPVVMITVAPTINALIIFILFNLVINLKASFLEVRAL